MTKIKLCGLSRPCDIAAANELSPEYIGFVFAQKSQRYVSHQRAVELKSLLNTNIKVVGVFVDESPEAVAELLNSGVIDVAQLHGKESEEYIKKLRTLTLEPIIKAFCIKTEQDVLKAVASSADYVLLDSAAGAGKVFDWNLIAYIERPYFLAGGLDKQNVNQAIKELSPYAVDVSSGIETDGAKDKSKMAAFVAAVRKEGNI